MHPLHERSRSRHFDNFEKIQLQSNVRGLGPVAGAGECLLFRPTCRVVGVSPGGEEEEKT